MGPKMRPAATHSTRRNSGVVLRGAKTSMKPHWKEVLSSETGIISTPERICLSVGDFCHPEPQRLMDKPQGQFVPVQ